MLPGSIIVPVYNSERTLERCIQAIQRQSFSDFEILLCEDGSADQSLQICDHFAFNWPESIPDNPRSRFSSSEAQEWARERSSDTHASHQSAHTGMRKIIPVFSSPFIYKPISGGYGREIRVFSTYDLDACEQVWQAFIKGG